MAGGANIDNVYIETFEENVRHLAQQMNTKLRATVTEKGTNGAQHNWERLDSSDPTDKTTSAPATPNTDLPWSRRVSVAGTKHSGSVVDNEDIVQMLVEPKSNIAKNLAMGMNRAYDDILLAAAGAASLNGDGSTTALPAGQIVGNGTGAINFDLVTQVQETFMANDIDPSMPKIMVVGPTQVRKLMQLTEQTSGDYVSREALQNLNASGIAPNWMGFTWILSTRLNVPSVGELDCFAWCPDGIGLQVNEDITIQVAQDPSASFAWRIYCRLTAGAVRIDDKKVVKLHVADTV